MHAWVRPPRRSPPQVKHVRDHSSALNTLGSLLRSGYMLTSVDSTDEHLVVTIRQDDRVERITLDREDARVILTDRWLPRSEPIPA